MGWQQISFEVQKSEVDLISEVLEGLGSLSITFKDAQGNDIYEPPVDSSGFISHEGHTHSFFPNCIAGKSF